MSLQAHEQLLWTLLMVVFARMIASKEHSYALPCYFSSLHQHSWTTEKSQFLIAPSLCCAVPNDRHKRTNVFPEACTKCKELHSTEPSQFPSTRSCYASLAESVIQAASVMPFSFLVILQYVYSEGATLAN